MATPSSIPAWEIPWTEEPSGLQPMRSKRGRKTEYTHTHNVIMVAEVQKPVLLDIIT